MIRTEIWKIKLLIIVFTSRKLITGQLIPYYLGSFILKNVLNQGFQKHSAAQRSESGIQRRKTRVQIPDSG